MFRRMLALLSISSIVLMVLAVIMALALLSARRSLLSGVDELRVAQSQLQPHKSGSSLLAALSASHSSGHSSGPIQEWLVASPRVHIEPTPKGACWLNLIEGWRRIFLRNAFAGRSFADHTGIETATTLATR